MNEPLPSSALDRCTELLEIANRSAASLTMGAAAGAAAQVDDLHEVMGRAIDELTNAAARLDERLAELQRAQVDAVVRDADIVRLNIGPGAERTPGWVNVDVANGDVVADLRRRLPFPDDCASHIYCSHVLEHLRNPDESYAFLRECHRVLRRGGKLRVVVPNIGEYLRAVIERDDGFWETHRQTWPWSRGDENRLDLTLRYAGAGPNPGDFFGHQHGYDADSLLDALRRAGFAPVKLCAFQQSSDAVFHLDDRSAVAHVQHQGRPLSLFAEGFALF